MQPGSGAQGLASVFARHADQPSPVAPLMQSASPATYAWWTWTVIGVISLAFGGTLFVAIVTQFRRGNSSRYWPTTPGRITSSRVQEGWDGRRLVYSLEVTYEYMPEVGKLLHGDTVQFGGDTFDIERDARKVAARYPAGASVPVRYNPRDPRHSTLEIGVRFPVRFGIGAAAAIFAMVFGVSCLLAPRI